MHHAKDTAVTRESKLALILSFVLILVVGVLVSDYFSQANSMDPERLEAERRQPYAQLPGAERASVDDAITRVMPSPTGRIDTQPMDQTQTRGPDVIANGSNRSGSLLDGLSNGFNQTIDDLRAPALASPLSNSSKNEPKPENTSRVLGQIRHAVYTVREGDSLYQIAARKLGDGNRWAEIQRLNAEMVGPSGIINPGMKLLLPLNARVTEPKASLNPRRQANAQSAPSRAGKAETYTVASGDTLGEISMKLLGTSRRVDEFVSLNGLDDANDIRVGMTLKVPKK